MKSKYLLLSVSLVLGSLSFGQSTYVPDNNFEQALIDLGYDDVLDDYVLTENIDHVNTLFLGNKNISSLTGIEAFNSISYIDCSQNHLTSLDISQNTTLSTLLCDKNLLPSLDVSKNTLLHTLDCSNNLLTNLDFSMNIDLNVLSCYSNQLINLDVSKNTLLTTFVCSLNQLVGLDISNNTALSVFRCYANQLTSLNVSKNLALSDLSCGSNQLTNLDVSKNTLLSTFNCSFNQINNLDVTNNPILKILNVWQNNLSSIDLSHNSVLEDLWCQENQLTTLGLSNNANLKQLICNNNQIASLDLSNNISLSEIYIYQNNLTNLNVRNGHNIDVSHFYANYNPSLTCVQVDDAPWSTANWPFIDATASYSEDCSGGNLTYVPDNNFEQALIDLGYDNVLDDYVLTSYINSVTSLDVNSKNISDLTGIEDFVALTSLKCMENRLTSINLSSNTNLTYLLIAGNLLTSLDVSHNIALTKLYCDENQLTGIDISSNISIDEFACFQNQLTSLNVSNNTAITHLLCYANQLTSLDVSNNTALIYFKCEENQLISMDVSNNTFLTWFSCNNNQMTSLNLKNGNNFNFGWFDATNNPNLTCIQVDNADWSTANWSHIDATASFSEDCGYSINDSDGDGIADNMDDYPNDFNRAFDNYFPAAGFGSLAFEDLWPGKGDYDFNDIVVDYRFLTVTNASNKVVEITGKFAVKASGASLQNGFGFNLPDASPDFMSNTERLIVTGSDLHESFITLKSNGLEDGQSKPTIIVFDDIYNILPHPGIGIGKNPELSAPFVPFDTITISMSTGIYAFTPEAFSLETWNPFIIINHHRGQEVHLPDHAPTDLVDQSIFGTYEDNSDPSISRYYKTSNNLPWAINIVSEFSWPVEKSSIETAYLHFKAWAESAGTLFTDWYEEIAGYRDDTKIYPIP